MQTVPAGPAAAGSTVRMAVVLCLENISNCKTKVGREALNDVKIRLFELMCQP